MSQARDDRHASDYLPRGVALARCCGSKR
jgi:hypothetical protein